MKILVGKYSGFCAGVNYTYNKALEELKKGSIYCLGRIIHNDYVIKELENLGMITINSLKEAKDNSKVIFRAHGETIDNYDYAYKHNIEIVDLTCGKVKIIHNKVLKEKKSSFIIIIGKKDHPEILGTKSFAGDDCYVLQSIDDIDNSYNCFLKSLKKSVYVISQTTFSSSLFDILVDAIKRKYEGIPIKIDKSICNATSNRQMECKEISKQANIVIVIGSKNSSNTKELYNIALKNCKNVIFAENESDVLNLKFKDEDIIGIVAGASTPIYLINLIVDTIRNSK